MRRCGRSGAEESLDGLAGRSTHSARDAPCQGRRTDRQVVLVDDVGAERARELDVVLARPFARRRLPR